MVVVPLNPSRLKEREYNQNLILAREVANYFKISLRDDIIFKIKDTPAQTLLDKKRRQTNLKGAFVAKENLQGKRVVLFDDIFTTGATILECSRVLKERGARVTLAITLSKTP